MANKLFNKQLKNKPPDNSETELLDKIMTRFRASYEKKQEMVEQWRVLYDYWLGDVNKSTNENDPGSQTNIIQPIIESQVAELVDGQKDILVKGVGPSDQPFALDLKHILNFVWRKNKMLPKLDEAERDRLNLGTVVWKVYWDPSALKGRGLPVMEPRSIENIFPDPRITHPRKINDGDFFIEVVPMTTTQCIRVFGDRGKLVKANGLNSTYDPRIFSDDNSSNEIMRDQLNVYEYWEKDEEGKLRLVYCTDDLILSDSFDSDEHDSFYEHGKFPYVIIPCYLRKGSLWGTGDTEQLIPTQDLINDLDDQIRINARLTGNNQTVVGTASGINAKKWDNTPGLKIPAKDPQAWKQVIPTPIPNYIPARRDRAFQESEVISGRSDVVEGRRSGSLRAASAILAMQEAGSRRANHKKLMNEEGFSEILDLLVEYIKEFMTTEQAFDIVDRDITEYMWFRGSDLKNIPWKTLNENFDPTSTEPGTERYKDLYEDVEVEDTDEEGNPVSYTEPRLMTKDAEFDVEISLGAGMPNNKSFLYEATIELMRENIITQEEARACLKQLLNWPIIDPFKPVGLFAGRNLSDEQLNIANRVPSVAEPELTSQPGEMPQQGMAPQQGMMPQQQMVIQRALAELPPEVATTLQTMLGGMAQ